MKKLIKNILKEEIERTREIMGLLVEQTQIQFHVWETCENGVIVSPYSTNTIFGQVTNTWNGVYDPMVWSQESQVFYNLMQQPNVGEVVRFDSTSDTTSAFQDAYGKCLKYLGVSSCPYNPPYNSPWDIGACSMFFGGALYENWSYVGPCSDCITCTQSPQQCGGQVTTYDCVSNACVPVNGPGGQYPDLTTCQTNCTPTSTLDCDTGGPDWTPQQWSWMAGWQNQCDAEQAAANCTWICNKVNQLTSWLASNSGSGPAGSGNQQYDKKHCKLEKVQAAANAVPCTTSNVGGCVGTTGGGCGVDQQWVQDRLNHYNSPAGCFGNPAQWSVGNPQPASFCGRKHHFCVNPGPTTTNKQLRCDWLSGTYVPPAGCPTVMGPPPCAC